MADRPVFPAPGAPKPLLHKNVSNNERLKLLPVRLQGAARLLVPGPLVVGLSGGLDSCALLHLLCCVIDRRKNPIHPCYIDHGIRPDPPEARAGALPEYCRSLGLELQIYRVRDGWLRREATRRGLSLEDLARSERYRRLQHYLYNLCGLYNLRGATESRTERVPEALAGAIVLAHHGDDQAENFFMNLGRGAGPGALAGMREWLRRPVCDRMLSLWRPLLSEGLRCGRRDLQNWAELHGLPHWEDSGNFDQVTLRNFYRWQVVPQLKRLLPGILQGVRRSQQHLALLEDWLEEERSLLRSQLCVTTGPEGGLCAEWSGSFSALGKPLQVELCFLLFDELRCGEQRRKRLPLDFANELLRQWQSHCRQGRKKPFGLRAHGCLWQLSPKGIRACTI
ncbi:tRNA lysidine(34) synthetase TilS [Candidatus Haliotispira prima]|uniref:tRNA(Ile)-lysidine synthase n=1 Tax=Candidatus Haliotispira prima TaxID=3034016 RepID=A0ABY8MLC4_9SPIO|nr:tRNA lysidine(34) synthetase TilS [Candidatus Haliotispira prima]